ncbi:hypothetical protein H6G89_33215 [Oscillatoria sp. FACHB-1407]|uniref:hypothetical protein n=1 Tax=Oscillatoria sp. FACHB-1407 TaxID=2692847 RepID=UPI0016878890|nr:hypothetical protein [Oscillatoria sp. FACHB-1407]MBD2465851.1 hypothetical protein [Oscillatoria sp. FACHB-1407]
MKLTTKTSEYHRLEFMLSSKPQTRFQPLQWLKQFGDVLIAILATNEDPIVRQICTRSGETYWKIYDPMSHRVIYCSSENEVRGWFDRRYYSR